MVFHTKTMFFILSFSPSSHNYDIGHVNIISTLHKQSCTIHKTKGACNIFASIVEHSNTSILNSQFGVCVLFRMLPTSWGSECTVGELQNQKVLRLICINLKLFRFRCISLKKYVTFPVLKWPTNQGFNLKHKNLSDFGLLSFVCTSCAKYGW